MIFQFIQSIKLITRVRNAAFKNVRFQKKKKKNQNVVNENAIKRFVKSRFNLLEYI
jgi:hypothetical protein